MIHHVHTPEKRRSGGIMKAGKESTIQLIIIHLEKFPSTNSSSVLLFGAYTTTKYVHINVDYIDFLNFVEATNKGVV